MSITLLFDIDGTLVRTGGAGKVAVETALMETFGVRNIRDTVLYSGRTDAAILADVLSVHDIPPSAANVQAFGDAYLERLPNCLKEASGGPCPGIVELLNALVQKPHVRLGLLTGNVRRGAEIKLGHYGLWDYFAFGGFGDGRTDRDDVARAAVAEAVRMHGPLDRQTVWVIGDTPMDVSCARAVKANALAVATGWHPIDELHATGADLVLEHLADVGRLPPVWFVTP